ncbi:MAG: ABC transporter ATP-binding protein/permease [Anaerolineae bacterium]|nr:ABC transporter ATP-binding protein/permease [Anaerolineae bacterium]
MTSAKSQTKVSFAQYKELLFKYLRPQRPSVLMLTVLLLGSIGLQLVNPQILRYFIDTATGSPSSLLDGSLAVYPYHYDNIDTELLMAALLFIGVALVQQAVAIGAVYVGGNVGWTATNMLRSDLAMHCMRLDMSFHHIRTPGEMIERVDTDVTQIANFFSQFVILVAGNIILLVGVIVLLFKEHPAVGLTMAVFSLFTLWALNLVRNLAVPAWGRSREASAQFYGFLEEQLAGTEDTRSSGAVDYVMRKFYSLNRERLYSERRAGYMNMVIFTVIVTCVTIGTIIALLLGYWLYTAGLATIGTVLLFITYTNMLFKPMREITMQIQELQRAGAGIVRVSELFSIQTKIKDGDGQETFPDGPLSVDFDHVTFAYQDNEPILTDFNFYLEPGKVMGLLGRTGSGKTTITRLLFRLYDTTKGTIRLGGTDIKVATLEDLRKHVGIVTQDVQLFRATVRDNLTFFDRSIPDDRILEAIHDLGLDEWLERMPNGLDSEMRSGGSGLSAGEAQLLAFTRVFLKNPGLIILDEASSRLDPVTEHHIEQAIDKLLHNRTAIIVAHRLATVQRADEIMIIEHGHIREHNQRESLASDENSHFYHLLQTGLEEALA